MSDKDFVPVKSEGTSVKYDPLGVDELFVIPDFEVLNVSDTCNPTTQYVCQCGSKVFSVHDKAGGYETSIQCQDCQEWYVVHEG